jgi:hypothetical protein
MSYNPNSFGLFGQAITSPLSERLIYAMDKGIFPLDLVATIKYKKLRN